MCFCKRIWQENAHNFVVISWHLHGVPGLGTCERAAFLAWMAAWAFPIIHVKTARTRSDRAVHIGFGPIQCFPRQGDFYKYDPDFHFSFVFGAFFSCVSHRLTCTCAFLYMNSRYIIKPGRPVSLLLPSPCGTARKLRVLIELSPSIAYPLPASCPQALEYSF